MGHFWIWSCNFVALVRQAASDGSNSSSSLKRGPMFYEAKSIQRIWQWKTVPGVDVHTGWTPGISNDQCFSWLGSTSAPPCFEVGQPAARPGPLSKALDNIRYNSNSLESGGGEIEVGMLGCGYVRFFAQQLHNNQPHPHKGVSVDVLGVYTNPCLFGCLFYFQAPHDLADSRQKTWKW